MVFASSASWCVVATLTLVVLASTLVRDGAASARYSTNWMKAEMARVSAVGRWTSDGRHSRRVPKKSGAYRRCFSHCFVPCAPLRDAYFRRVSRSSRKVELLQLCAMLNGQGAGEKVQMKRCLATFRQVVAPFFRHSHRRYRYSRSTHTKVLRHSKFYRMYTARARAKRAKAAKAAARRALRPRHQKSIDPYKVGIVGHGRRRSKPRYHYEQHDDAAADADADEDDDADADADATTDETNNFDEAALSELDAPDDADDASQFDYAQTLFLEAHRAHEYHWHACDAMRAHANAISALKAYNIAKSKSALALHTSNHLAALRAAQAARSGARLAGVAVRATTKEAKKTEGFMRYEVTECAHTCVRRCSSVRYGVLAKN